MLNFLQYCLSQAELLSAGQSMSQISCFLILYSINIIFEFLLTVCDRNTAKTRTFLKRFASVQCCCDRPPTHSHPSRSVRLELRPHTDRIVGLPDAAAHVYDAVIAAP